MSSMSCCPPPHPGTSDFYNMQEGASVLGASSPGPHLRVQPEAKVKVTTHISGERRFVILGRG